MATALLVLLVGSGWLAWEARAGCPSIVPEAVFGSAVRGKVGFECGECPKKFYLVEAYEGGSFIRSWGGRLYGAPYHIEQTWTYASGGFAYYDPWRWADGTARSSGPEGDGCGLQVYTGVISTNAYFYLSWSTYGEAASLWRRLEQNGQAVECVHAEFTGAGVRQWNTDCSWPIPTPLNCEELPLLEEQSLQTCELSGGRSVRRREWNDILQPGVYEYVGASECILFTGTMKAAEYTTAMLTDEVRRYAQDRLPASFPEDGSALGQTPAVRSTLSADESCASASACRWRARVSGTVEGEKYRIRYKKVVLIQRRGTITRTTTPIEQIVEAPGETWYFPSEQGEVLSPPSWVLGHCADGSAGLHQIWLEGFEIEWVESADPPGSGGPGPGCGPPRPGGADSRGGVPGRAADSSQLWGGCVHCEELDDAPEGPGLCFRVALGSAEGGGSAGDLYFSASELTDSTATPSVLAFSGQHGLGGVQVIRSLESGQLLQVVTPQAVANIDVEGNYKYHIRVYHADGLGNWDPQQGRYGMVNPAAHLITTWTLENPDAGAATNRLRITEQPRGGVARVWLYTYTNATRTATLTLPGSLVEQRTTETFTRDGDGRLTRTVVTQIAAPGSAPVHTRSRIYKLYDWGEALVSDTLGTGADARTTHYTYWPTPSYRASSSRPPVRDVIRPDGSWTRTAAYDSRGRPLQVLTGIDTGPTNELSLCRATLYDYTPVAPGDDGTESPDEPRTVTELFKGQPVARTYYSYVRTLEQIITTTWRCANPNHTFSQAQNDPNTERTVSVRSALTGRSLRDEHPDGTITLYAYTTDPATGRKMTITRSGQPNADKTAVVAGTEEVTVQGPWGQPLSRTVTDIATGVVLSRQTYSDFDAFGRPGRVTYLDGTFELTQYSSCCGHLESSTDRDGVLTQYLYDAAGRATGQRKLYGSQTLTFTNLLDAAGRVLARWRSAGDQTLLLSQARYDAAGRLLSETNALGGVTTYTNYLHASGQWINLATHPDGGTRIETYDRGGQLRSVTGTAVLPVRYVHGVQQDGPGGPWLQYTKEIKLNTDGSETGEWTKTYYDALGRITKIVYADATPNDESDNPSHRYFYNSKGQLRKEVDPDGVTTLYEYNAQGEREYTVLDFNRNDQIDWNGLDRITRTVRTVLPASQGRPDRIRADSYVWLDGQTQGTLVRSVETSTDGLQSWQTTWDNGRAVTTRTQIAYGTDGARTVTTFAPDNSYTLSLYEYGRLKSVTRYDATGQQVSKTSYTYDAHGRQWQVTDARTGTTTYTYNNADLVESVTTPDPDGPGPARPQTTTTYYNKALQATNVVQPDGTSVFTEYYLNGLVRKTWGSRTYPVEYTYDYAGRLKTMTTWQQFHHQTGQGISGAATTTWNYDPYRGWLASKRYADNTGPTYTYTPAGRLAGRRWARTVGGQPLLTTYHYNPAGDLQTVDYSDATPDVTYGYDRLGRQVSISSGGMTLSRVYSASGLLLAERYLGGVLNGLAVTNLYDAALRRTNLAVWRGTSHLYSVDYRYDPAGRLASVSDGTHAAAYSYLPQAGLVEQIRFSRSGQDRLTTTRQFDLLNRLTQISNTGGTGSTLALFSYTYNEANQRVRVDLADGSFWIYQYDALGQVISGKRYWSDGTPVAGQQFEYGFDDIGNRKVARRGGDENGWNLRESLYGVNVLNQYTNRTVPGFVDVVGVALATKPVYVNGQMASRKGEYFRRELSVNNAGGPVWLGVTVTSPGEPTVTGNLFVPRTPEVFTHDLDGNLTSDGRWTNTWDAENRLLRVQSRSDTPQGSWRRVEWQYDALGRRIRQTTWSWLVQSNLWVVTEDLKFVSDPLLFGRHIAELRASDNALVRSYVWGLDLSGTMDGAGGVGGLLWVTLHTGSGPTAGTHFCAYDGNGNVVALASASDGSPTARYEYGPFGEPIRHSCPAATLNPFRFSTKRTDSTTDLVLYEYRAYNPALGRWLSRDPIAELGFTLLGGGTLPITGMEFDDESNGAPISERGDENLYVIVGNDPISFLDILGLVDFRFEPVVGELSGMIVRAGHWGQPFNYADGSASSSSKSAHTFIKVWSGPTSRGSCNTVQFKGKYGDNAGAITVYAQDNCPGKYKIYFDLTYEIKTTGPRGNALLKVDKIKESVVGRTATIKKKKMIAVIVNIPAKQEVSVLRYDPIISFPPEPRNRNSTGSIDFNVEVVRVKKVD